MPAVMVAGMQPGVQGRASFGLGGVGAGVGRRVFLQVHLDARGRVSHHLSAKARGIRANLLRPARSAQRRTAAALIGHAGNGDPAHAEKFRHFLQIQFLQIQQWLVTTGVSWPRRLGLASGERAGALRWARYKSALRWDIGQPGPEPDAPATGGSVQGEHLGPADQFTGQCDDLAPDPVLHEATVLAGGEQPQVRGRAARRGPRLAWPARRPAGTAVAAGHCRVAELHLRRVSRGDSFRAGLLGKQPGQVMTGNRIRGLIRKTRRGVTQWRIAAPGRRRAPSPRRNVGSGRPNRPAWPYPPAARRSTGLCR